MTWNVKLRESGIFSFQDNYERKTYPPSLKRQFPGALMTWLLLLSFDPACLNTAVLNHAMHIVFLMPALLDHEQQLRSDLLLNPCHDLDVVILIIDPHDPSSHNLVGCINHTIEPDRTMRIVTNREHLFEIIELVNATFLLFNFGIVDEDTTERAASRATCLFEGVVALLQPPRILAGEHSRVSTPVLHHIESEPEYSRLLAIGARQQR